MSNETQWVYNNETVSANTIPEGAIGFVYEITNLSSGRRYIGKKSLFFSKTRRIKGKKKKEKVESDWREYYSSSVELNEDVKNLGVKNFKREILRFCSSKGEMSYYESKFILGTDAIIKDTYYNGWLSCRIRNTHLKHLLK